MAALLDGLSWALLIGGSLFAMIGGLGLLRFPDFYSRMHGGGITDTMGAGLILSGLALQSGLSLVTVKLAMILFFLLVTSPTSAHALAQAARAHGLPVWTRESGRIEHDEEV
jgi:multicomponent Na+:H+ antiporter subunit G